MVSLTSKRKGLMLGAALILIAGNVVAVQPLEILNVFVDSTNQQIYITGANFDNGSTLEVHLGELGPLTIDSQTATTIVVNLPTGCGIPNCVLPGDYLLSITSGGGTVRHDEYDLTIGADGLPGVDGVDGVDGLPGVDGEDGVDGLDGTSCSVNPTRPSGGSMNSP